MNKRLLLNLGKYVLAAGLLGMVIAMYWAPSPNKAVATLAASSVGLCASPGGYGPLVAASAVVPDRTEPRGLGYVWKRHVVQHQPIHFGYLAAAFTLFAVSVVLTFFRWYLLVHALDLPLSLRDAMRYGLIGMFFNAFLPGSVGGDIVKAAALARGQRRRAAAVATVVMDRLIALWALVWLVALLGGLFWVLGLLTGPAGAVSASIVAISAFIVAISAGVWLLMGLLPDHRAERFARRLLHLPAVGHTAAEFWRSAWMYRRRQKSVAVVMLLCWVGHLGFVLTFWCCAYALWSPELGPIPSLTEHFLLVPIGLTIQSLVPTPGGAGAGEWGFAALYVLFRASEANGVLGSLVQRILSWVLGLACAGVYLWMRPAAAPKPAVATHPAMMPSISLPEPAGSALAS